MFKFISITFPVWEILNHTNICREDEVSNIVLTIMAFSVMGVHFIYLLDSVLLGLQDKIQQLFSPRSLLSTPTSQVKAVHLSHFPACCSNSHIGTTQLPSSLLKSSFSTGGIFSWQFPVSCLMSDSGIMQLSILFNFCFELRFPCDNMWLVRLSACHCGEVT